MRAVLCLLVVSASLAACLAPGSAVSLVRENLSERDEDYRIVALADGLRRVGRRQDAEVLVTGLLGEDPLFVPAARLHQDLLRQRGRAGVLWREVEANAYQINILECF